MSANDIHMALTGLTGFKTAVEIIKSISNISKNSEVKEKIIGLQNAILSLQAEYGELLDIKNQLEKKLTEYEDWDKTESQYQLKEIASGVFVYESKKDEKSTEPKHQLCTNCFSDHKKSILQGLKGMKGLEGYYCPKCETKFPM